MSRDEAITVIRDCVDADSYTDDVPNPPRRDAVVASLEAWRDCDEQAASAVAELGLDWAVDVYTRHARDVLAQKAP